MTEPSLRLKVTDFLATDFEQEVFQELMKLKQLDYLSGVSFPLYFWYDRETEAVDLNTLSQFITYWKSSGEFRTKITIIPELTDDQNHYIFYDIIPKDTKPNNPLGFFQYRRFYFEYTNPRDIVKGLQEFRKTYEFINKDEINPEPIRKQKRND